MSEVKLYVHTSTIVYDKFFQQEMESVGLRPATTAEIMEAHPKCGECRHCKDPRVTWMDPYDRTCYNQASPSFLKTVHMLDDYCRHWEAKE